MKTITITSDAKMTNREWRRQGEPKWWARVGAGEDAIFLDIERVRGDKVLDIEVDVDDDVTEIVYGVGKGSSGTNGVRGTVEC